MGLSLQKVFQMCWSSGSSSNRGQLATSNRGHSNSNPILPHGAVLADPWFEWSASHGHLPFRLETAVRANANALDLHMAATNDFHIDGQARDSVHLHSTYYIDVGGLATHHVHP